MNENVDAANREMKIQSKRLEWVQWMIKSSVIDGEEVHIDAEFSPFSSVLLRRYIFVQINIICFVWNSNRCFQLPIPKYTFEPGVCHDFYRIRANQHKQNSNTWVNERKRAREKESTLKNGDFSLMFCHCTIIDIIIINSNNSNSRINCPMPKTKLINDNVFIFQSDHSNICLIGIASWHLQSPQTFPISFHFHLLLVVFLFIVCYASFSIYMFNNIHKQISIRIQVNFKFQIRFFFSLKKKTRKKTFIAYTVCYTRARAHTHTQICEYLQPIF